MNSDTDLFGEDSSDTAILKVFYRGKTFEGGQMKLRVLYTELESLEKIIKKTVYALVDSGKLEEDFKDFDVYIQLEDGSFGEIIKVIFSKKNVSGMVAGSIISIVGSTYNHFLTEKSIETGDQSDYRVELQQIINDVSLRNDLKNVISPLADEGDTFVVEDNHGTININITKSEQERIFENLEEKEDETLKNGEFEETLRGTIRKLDLDASKDNYFGFNIDGGKRVPTSVSGEFDFNEYRDLIDKHVEIVADVEYKNNEPVHILIKDYKVLHEQTKMGFEEKYGEN